MPRRSNAEGRPRTSSPPPSAHTRATISQQCSGGAGREAPRAGRAHLLHADELRAEVELDLGLAHGCLERVRDGREDRLEQLRDARVLLRVRLRRVARACAPEPSAPLLSPFPRGVYAPRISLITLRLMLPGGVSSRVSVNSLRSRKSVPLLTMRISPSSRSAPSTSCVRS